MVWEKLSCPLVTLTAAGTISCNTLFLLLATRGGVAFEQQPPATNPRVSGSRENWHGREAGYVTMTVRRTGGCRGGMP